MKPKIICAGHICLDITPVFPAGTENRSLKDLLTPGKLLHMEGVDVHTGGRVANTGLALKMLGNEVRLLGKIGKDAFGSVIQSVMSSSGADGLIVDQESTTSYSIVLAPPGCDRIFLHDPGANDSFSSSDIPESVLENTVLFHFGYPPLMKRMYADNGKELTQIFRRIKEHGIAASLDFSAIDPNSDAGQADWENILQNVLPYVDFFVPSFEELCFMLDQERYRRLNNGSDMTKDLDLVSEAMPLAQRVIDMGCRVSLIKCGTSGMVYRTAGEDRLAAMGNRLDLDRKAWADQAGIQPCFKAECVRSGTGAGDTSIAAFLTAVLRGYPPADCARLAAAEGALCVTSYDALSAIRPIEELMDKINAGWTTMNNEVN